MERVRILVKITTAHILRSASYTVTLGVRWVQLSLWLASQFERSGVCHHVCQYAFRQLEWANAHTHYQYPRL